MLDNRTLPSEGEPITLEQAIEILSDGRPIRRSLRRECITVVRKAVNKLYALENLYEQTGNIEKQIAMNLIENFERDTKDIIKSLKERFKINE